MNSRSRIGFHSKRATLFMLVLILTALMVQGVQASPGYYCYRTAEPPAIDGQLDDRAWQDVPWLACRNVCSCSIASVPMSAM